MAPVKEGARASTRATFSRIDTLTNASVLPGVGRHYLDRRNFTECQAKQTASHYVPLDVRKTLKIKGLFHNSTASSILSRAVRSLNSRAGLTACRPWRLGAAGWKP